MYDLGSNINHVDSLGGRGGYPNDHFITQALFSKSDHERGGGVKNTQKIDHVVYG